MRMSPMKWLYGYGSFLDWFIVPATPENEKDYGDKDWCAEADTFAQAKKELIECVKQRIDDDKCALKEIRKRKAKT